MTDFNKLRSNLSEKEAAFPQKSYLVIRALHAAEEAIGDLAKLGYVFNLVEGPSQAPAEWPKMLYNDELAPHGQVFPDEESTKSLGPGWRDHPSPEDVRQKAEAPAEAGAPAEASAPALPPPTAPKAKTNQEILDDHAAHLQVGGKPAEAGSTGATGATGSTGDTGSTGSTGTASAASGATGA